MADGLLLIVDIMNESGNTTYGTIKLWNLFDHNGYGYVRPGVFHEAATVNPDGAFWSWTPEKAESDPFWKSFQSGMASCDIGIGANPSDFRDFGGTPFCLYDKIGYKLVLALKGMVAKEDDLAGNMLFRTKERKGFGQRFTKSAKQGQVINYFCHPG